jgi:N6-L-threonylcarbamoyladenine synthase
MKKSLTVLAIETSCDETAAAVIRDGRILSSVVASQAALHSKFGGVVPEVAAREHVPAMIPSVDLALRQAKLKLADMDYLAVTQGPGLATSLMVGIDTAKAMSVATGLPLIAVNHMEAHIYANFVKKAAGRGLKAEVDFPALILIVSGGHTLLVLMTGHGKYKVLGETVDDAAGEAFDKSAKLMGLGYPGGPQISQHAQHGNSQAFDFPRPMLKNPGFDFSFSGLKTAVLYEYAKHKTKSARLINDMAASVQQAIIDTLIGKTGQALKKFQPKTLMLGGGVAANEMLRTEFLKLGKKYKVKVSIPKLEYCTDNAGMIGLAAYYRLQNHKAKPVAKLPARPQLPLK